MAHMKYHSYQIIYPLAILNSPKIEKKGCTFYATHFSVFGYIGHPSTIHK